MYVIEYNYEFRMVVKCKSYGKKIFSTIEYHNIKAVTYCKMYYLG